ncbi:MAG: carboxypeptidase M32 [Thermodesulfobacteriota bacterium]
MTAHDAYDRLVAHHRQTALFGSALALLHWDQRTHIPEKGHDCRAEQVAALARLIHSRNTDPRLGDDLAAAAAGPAEPDSPRAANLREMRRAYDRAARIPEDLAAALALACARAESAWERARPANDWKGFLPHLEEVLALRRQEAEAVGYAAEPYDALLDAYEPYATAADMVPLFAALRPALVALLDRIRGSARRPDPALLRRPIPAAAQEAFARQVAQAIGYDFAAGRLDRTAHPFATRIAPGDTRITTRFKEDRLAEALFGVIHEAGHALYEQGLPAGDFGLPTGEAVSLGLHESQSRLWENVTARSRGFWTHFLPLAQEQLPALAGIPLDDFVFAVNEVTPGLIRVDADEVTYNLHVLLRFELELALVRGDLPAADLPGAWNDAMRDTLGLTPPDFASGVMQDVHWSAGLFGYFPTYTLGNVIAAQLAAAMRRDLGDPEPMHAKGDFAPQLAWLREKIHVHGSRYAPRDLVRRATGAEPDPAFLIRYLEEKYGALYGL